MPQPSRHVTARLSIRRGSKAQWEQENTILLEGELGWEIDGKRLKVGDGQTAWSDLQFYKVGNSEAAESFIHDNTILPEYINSVSSALEYFGAKLKVFDDQGVNEFIAGLQGTVARYVLTVASGSGGTAVATASGSTTSVVTGNSAINIKATPFSGYEFDYWQGAGITDINLAQTDILVTSDQYVRANFKIITS
jgi:hypothetical protein